VTAFGDWLEPVIYSFAGDLRWHNFPRYTSAHRCGSKHIFWGGRICARISPNFPEKLFCKVCLQIFSHKDYEDLFLVWAPKQRFQVFFCKRWAPFFLEFSGILPRYLGILFGFSTNPHFWGCACTPCTPSPTPLLQRFTQLQQIDQPTFRLVDTLLLRHDQSSVVECPRLSWKAEKSDLPWFSVGKSIHRNGPDNSVVAPDRVLI